MKVELKNISKSFKNIDVIKNINYTFESGKIYGLYGRNGSGKSVLLKLICGFLVPTSGSILFDGINFNENLEFPKDLRALIEAPSFFPDLTGYENLKMLAKIQNTIGDKEIHEALDIVNLTNEMNKKYKKYSLGMKQKLGIAQAIMEDADVLILDEPFNGIEQVSVTKIMNYLLELKNKGKLIIVSSHIIEDLNKISDTLLLMDDGILKEAQYLK